MKKINQGIGIKDQNQKTSSNIILNSMQNLTVQDLDCSYNLHIRVRPRFFDQVGHETMYAPSGNKHFFTKSCHHQT